MSSLKTLKHLWLVIITTLDCNLRCKYCYAKGGDRKDKTESELTQNFIEAFIKKAPALKRLTVTFFGGEPTLNFPLIKKTVSFCKKLELPVDFRISTNGMCDIRIWKYLIQNNFEIALSMDGMPKFNNLLRGLSAGLEEKIKILVNNEVKFHIRTTLMDSNISHFPRAVEWWSKLGVPAIHFEVLSPMGRAQESNIKPPKNQSLYKNVKKTVEIAEDENIFLIHSSWMNLTDPLDYFCTSCKGIQFILLPSGKISSCFMVESEDNPIFEKFIVGKMKGSKIVFNGNSQELENISVKTMCPCNRCEVKKICSGGCLAKHLAATGSLLTPSPDYCKVKKLLINIGQKALNKSYKCVLGFNFLNQKREERR